MIGTLGPDIVFETSDSRIFTFQGMSREVSSRWTSHDLPGVKPKKEYLGPGAQTITLPIQLCAAHGVKPRATLDAIARMVEQGNAEYLIIGQRPVGANPFCLTACSETWDTVLQGGELYRATVSLTLEEYT